MQDISAVKLLHTPEFRRRAEDVRQSRHATPIVV